MSVHVKPLPCDGILSQTFVFFFHLFILLVLLFFLCCPIMGTAHLYKYWSLVSFPSTVCQHNYQCCENTAITSLCTGTAPSAGPWCRLAGFRRCCAATWLHGSWYADWNCGAELASRRGHVSGFFVCYICLIERKAGEEDSEVSEGGTNRRITKITW